MVAQRRDEQLGGERLLGVPRRALALAAAALGARREVEQALPGEVLDRADPEPGVLGEVLEGGDVERAGGDLDRLERAPSAVRPSASRLNQMLKKARKRCQATPIVGVSEMVIIHAKEMRIFTAATTTIAASSPVVPVPKSCPARRCPGSARRSRWGSPRPGRARTPARAA